MNISFPSYCYLRHSYSNQQHPISNSFDLNTPKTTITSIGKVKANHHRLIPFSSSSQGRVSAIKSAGGDDAFSSPAKSLRRLLDSPGIHLGPACFDALSAKLVERAGFDFCFTTGRLLWEFRMTFCGKEKEVACKYVRVMGVRGGNLL